MLKLGCANCGAPLEIGPDLDTFACGYCGSQQRVERKGGTVALRKVEAAIKAVQRGTDRTAAELALPRLNRELEELRTQTKARLLASEQRYASQNRGQVMLTGIAFLGLLFASPLVAAQGSGWLVPYAVVVVGIPMMIFRTIKKTPDDRQEIQEDFARRSARIAEHIKANRAVLDELPH